MKNVKLFIFAACVNLHTTVLPDYFEVNTSDVQQQEDVNKIDFEQTKEWINGGVGRAKEFMEHLASPKPDDKSPEILVTTAETIESKIDENPEANGVVADFEQTPVAETPEAPQHVSLITHRQAIEGFYTSALDMMKEHKIVSASMITAVAITVSGLVVYVIGSQPVVLFFSNLIVSPVFKGLCAAMVLSGVGYVSYKQLPKVKKILGFQKNLA